MLRLDSEYLDVDTKFYDSLAKLLRHSSEIESLLLCIESREHRDYVSVTDAICGLEKMKFLCWTETDMEGKYYDFLSNGEGEARQFAAARRISFNHFEWTLPVSLCLEQ